MSGRNFLDVNRLLRHTQMQARIKCVLFSTIISLMFALLKIRDDVSIWLLNVVKKVLRSF